MSDLLAALAADADLRAVAVDLEAGPRRAVLRAQEGDVGHVERHVLVDDPALHRHPGRALVLLGEVHALDDDLVLVGQGTHDGALLALVLAGEHAHAVALADLHATHHRTSGASDTILMNFLSRSSRPTGPKMRVPRGCCWSLDRKSVV